MLDFLFNVFIYPIEWLMQIILSVIFAITYSYGVSIIILSVVINIFILPFYYLAEDIKKSHQDTLDTLQPKIDLFRNNFSGQELYHYLNALYKIYGYHPLDSVKASFGLLLQIPFFFAAFHFLGDYEAFNGINFGFIKDLGRPDGLLFGQNILPILMVIIGLFLVHQHAGSNKYQLYGLLAIFLVLLYFESSALLLYWITGNLFSLIRNWAENKFNIASFREKIVGLLVMLVQKTKQNKVYNSIVRSIFVQSVILFFGIIFIYKAIPIAASDTGMYLSDYLSVVKKLLIFFIISIVISVLIYRLLPIKIKQFFTVFVSFLAVSGLFYSFIMPFDVGQVKSLIIPSFYITQPAILKALQLVPWVFLFIIWVFLFKKSKHIILPILLVSNIILLIQTLKKGVDPKEIDVLVDKSVGELSINQVKKAYSFSKDSNTLVMMMDSFQSNMFADILEKHPKIKQDFSGFVYYPNTLSHGWRTVLSMSTIAGGEDFQIQHIPQQQGYEKIKNENLNLAYIPKNMSYLRNMEMVKKYKHSYNVFNPSYVKCDLFNTGKDSLCFRGVITNQQLLEKKNKILEEGYRDSSYQHAFFFAKLSWILSLPHQAKSTISSLFPSSSFEEYDSHLRDYSQLKNMINFSNADSEKKTFKFISNKLTHESFVINDRCQVVNEIFTGYQGVFNTDYCALQLLADFLDRLKTIGVYDQTKIIIVSDHGQQLSTKNNNIKEPKASALLMVKDFDQSGDLKTSMQFLSNIDTFGIALSGVSENKEIQLDRIKTPEDNRSLIFIKRTTPWLSYNITKAFKVKDNIFEDDNWQELDQEQILQLSHPSSR